MNSKFFNLILDGRGRIRTARNNGNERGLSLRNRRAWYADDPPATPATSPTPQATAPETEKSGAVDSGEGDTVPDWVKDPLKAYDAIRKVRQEAAEARKEAATLKAEKDRLTKEEETAKKKKLADDGEWKQLAEDRAKEIEDIKADYESKLQVSMRKLIGKEFDLPEKLVARLQGATEDELRADAADLAKDLGLAKAAKTESEKPADQKPEPETQAARGQQQTTTAVPGGQPVGRTDADRRSDYLTGVRQSPIFQGGGVVNHGKSDLD